jgi:hypothetical protein
VGRRESSKELKASGKKSIRNAVSKISALSRIDE